MNTLRTAILMAAMTGVLGVCGFLIGGEGTMLFALVIAGAGNLFAFWNADRIVLRMHNAREVDRRAAPELYGTVERLVRRAGLPMPKVYVIDAAQPNAFATGRNPDNAAVAATTGLLRILNRDELAGVMAHELAHIKNRDTLTMTITATVAGAVSALVSFAMFAGMFGGGHRNGPLGGIGVLLVMILGPIAAALVQMAISRTSASTPPTGRGARSAATRCGSPRHWKSFRPERRGPTTRRRNATPRRRTCSSSTRSTPTGWTGCSPPTRGPRTGWRRWYATGRGDGYRRHAVRVPAGSHRNPRRAPLAARASR